MQTLFRNAAALLTAVGLLTFALGAATDAAAQGSNVTGEWAFNVTTDQGGGTFAKVERAHHFVLPAARFEKKLDMASLLLRLFGPRSFD